MHRRRQGFQGGDCHFQFGKAEQGPALRIVHHDLPEGDPAGEPKDRLGAGGVEKVQDEVGVQFGRRDLKGRFCRDIGQVMGEVQILDLQIEGRFPLGGKGEGAPLEQVAVIVDQRGEKGLHVTLRMIIQIGDKGDGEVHLPDPVLSPPGTVVEVDAAVLDLDVVEGKFRRSGVLRFLVLFLRDEIGEIVAAVGKADDPKAGAGDMDLVEDQRPAGQRGGARDIHPQLLQGQEGLFSLPVADGYTPDTQGQSGGIEG